LESRYEVPTIAEDELIDKLPLVFSVPVPVRTLLGPKIKEPLEVILDVTDADNSPPIPSEPLLDKVDVEAKEACPPICITLLPARVA